MAVKEQVLTELDDLIQEGSRLNDSYQTTEMGTWASNLPELEFRSFVTSAFAAVGRVAGEGSEYYRALPKVGHNAISEQAWSNTTIPTMVGALKSLREAVDKGYLVSLEDRIRANIHDDFLQQGRVLLDAGYHVAAMVLIGGVLEDHMAKLCTKNGLTWTGNASISKYNDALHQGGIYDKPTWRRIQSIGDVRNDAAHGNGAKVKADDVEDAYRFVGRIIVDHPA